MPAWELQPKPYRSEMKLVPNSGTYMYRLEWVSKDVMIIVLPSSFSKVSVVVVSCEREIRVGGVSVVCFGGELPHATKYGVLHAT